MKKIISIMLSATILTALIAVPSFAKNEEKYKNYINQKSNLSQLAVSSNYNIMVYDFDGKIIDEFHTDGESVNYSYDDTSKKLKSINSNNGNSVKFDYKTNKDIIIEKYDKDNLQETTIIKNNTSKDKLKVSKEIRTETLKLASKGLLPTITETKSQDTIMATLTGDTIDGGYNLSTLCPSVWTAAVGADKFCRPSTAMTKTSIQQFLESKNSVLKNDIKVYALNSSGTVYDTGRTVNPATAIDNASRTYTINPKIILGSLQREQGLITKTTGDVSTRAFYFCMGYGATDGGDINSCSGFDIQIDKGTDLYADLWYEAYNKGQSSFPLSFNASDGTLNINNCGTYALYKYTPWKQSNKLFLQIMKGYWPDANGVNGINWN